MAFEVMIYTDAERGEGVHGNLGFQFQAESAGVDAECESFAMGVLYQVPVPLAEVEAPLDQFPESYSFAHDGQRMYLARGRYLGECHDKRLGNQVTQILVTAEPADLVPYQPAQLLSSSIWKPAKSPTTELEPVGAPLTIATDLELPALHDLVVSTPGAAEALPAFVSMFEQAVQQPARRLVLVHPDPRTIVRWIALGSAFLDRAEAQRLPFTVPSLDPLGDGRFPVVGSVPGTTTQTVHIGAEGVNTLHLGTFEHGPVEVSESAARHAEWFLGGDPYLAAEAIELARRWSALMPAAPASLAAGALLLDQRSSRRLDEAAAVALRELAKHGNVDDLDEYADELVDLVHAFDPTRTTVALAVEAWAALSAHGHDALAASVALAALERAAADPTRAREWIERGPAATAPVAWDDEARRHAGGLIASVLVDLPEDVLPAGFTWARTFGAEVPVTDLAPAIRRLAARWARDPGLEARSQGWLHSDLVVADLVPGLRAAVRGPARTEVGAAIRAGTWDWVLGPLDPKAPDPLAPWAVGRRLAAMAPEDAVASLRALAPSFEADDWDAIFGPDDQADVAALRVWLEVQRTVPPGFADLIDRTIWAAARDMTRTSGLVSFLDVIATTRPPGMSAATLELAAQAEPFRHAMNAALRTQDDTQNSSARSLTRYDQRLFAIHHTTLATLVVRLRDSDAMANLLVTSRLDLGIPVAEAWRRYLETHAVWTLRRGLTLWAYRDWPGSIRRELEEAMLAAWTDPAYAGATTTVRNEATLAQSDALEALLRTSGLGGRMKRSLGRRWDARGSGSPGGDGGAHG